MQVKSDALASLLAKGVQQQRLPAVFVVASDEPLLALEAQDAIRAAARQLGYTEREVLHADGRYDWSQLANASQSMSLFAERKIIEIRLPTGKPGVAGAEALERHAQAADDSVLTLIALPKLDKRALEARWVSALEQAGVLIDIPVVARPQLPAWIGRRLARQQQNASSETLDFIADCVEGNLLAAHQEIVKLGLLFPAGELQLDDVQEAVLNVSRHDTFALPLAMLAGDPARFNRSLNGLQAEGEAIPLLLWSLSEELRALLRVKTQVQNGRPFAMAARENRLWGPREALYQKLLPRLSTAKLERLLAHAADIDRLSKGLRPGKRDSDAWLELSEPCLEVSRV